MLLFAGRIRRQAVMVAACGPFVVWPTRRFFIGVPWGILKRDGLQGKIHEKSYENGGKSMKLPMKMGKPMKNPKKIDHLVG